MADLSQDRMFRHLNWMLNDALDHAGIVASRAQEAMEGTADTLLFDAARFALHEFRETHPAMRALRAASTRGLK